MARGPGTIIKQTAHAFFVRTNGGSGCSACDELAQELDSVGPMKVMDDLEVYTTKFENSVRNWRRVNNSLMPQPPRITLEKFLIYACEKSMGEMMKK